MTFPFDDEFESSGIEVDWKEQPKKMLSWKEKHEKFKNEQIIKSVHCLLPVIKTDLKAAKEAGNEALINELTDVNWWLLEKIDEYLEKNGECIE